VTVVDFSKKRVAVVGLGASGVAAARLCLRRGARVVATDTKPEGELSDEAKSLASVGAVLALGGHSEAKLSEVDLIVVSPGVPSFPELEAAERAKVPIIGEIELAVSLLRFPAPIVAVGGTNGKSTTTSLIGAMLERHGRTFTGGNLGEPLANHADERFDAIVLEVSSFQLERLRTFRPDVSVLLNVTDDHLDRYPSFDAYAQAKGNAFVRQTSRDVAVIPEGDPVCEREARRGEGRIVTFGAKGTVRITADAVVDTRSGDRFLVKEIALRGGHNVENAAAAIAAVRELSVDTVAIREVLASFRGLPHRMALAGDVGGVRYYDDSKGTNVGAAVTALLGLTEPRAVLIAGGRDKGGSYLPLVEALRKKGRAAVLIGEAASAIAAAIGDAVPVHQVASMGEAVRTSARLALPGDAVLLSPACSSYDMFKDYKDRGNAFVREVQALESPSARARREEGAQP
jgi:UDP-N-acetylmuramoylalanine--D-glutamate ligase